MSGLHKGDDCCGDRSCYTTANRACECGCGQWYCSHCWTEHTLSVQQARIEALESQRARLRKAWERYVRNDLDREEFEGVVAEIAEGHS